MAIMPGASRVQKFSGNRHKAKVDKIVLHTTEGGSWPGYGGGGSAPHFTVHRDGTIRQHIDTAYSSKALENDRGGVETNNDGCIQIEFIGSCDRSYARKHGLFFVEDATDRDFAGLAKVLAWIHETHGVVLSTRDLKWSDTNAAYESAPQRMSFAQWRKFTGVCGHTHVPENAHWDPGLMDVDRVVELARRLAVGGTVPSGGAAAPAQKPAAKPAVTKDGQLVTDGRMGTASSKALQWFLNDRVKTRKLKIDGRLGPDTYRSLQEYLGHPVVDGLLEHQSYKPEELGNGIGPHGWEYEGRGAKGSKTVRRLQKWVGVGQDGVWYQGTTEALQRKLNSHGVGMS